MLPATGSACVLYSYLSQFIATYKMRKEANQSMPSDSKAGKISALHSYPEKRMTLLPLVIFCESVIIIKCLFFIFQGNGNAFHQFQHGTTRKLDKATCAKAHEHFLRHACERCNTCWTRSLKGSVVREKC